MLLTANRCRVNGTFPLNNLTVKKCNRQTFGVRTLSLAAGEEIVIDQPIVAVTGENVVNQYVMECMWYVYACAYHPRPTRIERVAIVNYEPRSATREPLYPNLPGWSFGETDCILLVNASTVDQLTGSMQMWTSRPPVYDTSSRLLYGFSHYGIPAVRSIPYVPARTVVNAIVDGIASLRDELVSVRLIDHSSRKMTYNYGFWAADKQNSIHYPSVDRCERVLKTCDVNGTGGSTPAFSLALPIHVLRKLLSDASTQRAELSCEIRGERTTPVSLANIITKTVCGDSNLDNRNERVLLTRAGLLPKPVLKTRVTALPRSSGENVSVQRYSVRLTCVAPAICTSVVGQRPVFYIGRLTTNATILTKFNAMGYTKRRRAMRRYAYKNRLVIRHGSKTSRPDMPESTIDWQPSESVDDEDPDSTTVSFTSNSSEGFTYTEAQSSYYGGRRTSLIANVSALIDKLNKDIELNSTDSRNLVPCTRSDYSMTLWRAGYVVVCGLHYSEGRCSDVSFRCTCFKSVQHITFVDAKVDTAAWTSFTHVTHHRRVERYHAAHLQQREPFVVVDQHRFVSRVVHDRANRRPLVRVDYTSEDGYRRVSRQHQCIAAGLGRPALRSRQHTFLTRLDGNATRCVEQPRGARNRFHARVVEHDLRYSVAMSDRIILVTVVHHGHRYRVYAVFQIHPRSRMYHTGNVLTSFLGMHTLVEHHHAEGDRNHQ